MIARLAVPITILMAALAVSPGALAQPVDQATQDAARTLGRAGLELFDKGELTGALAKFEQAYSLYKAPTLGLLSARCLVKLGRLRDASERYREVVGIDLGAAPAEAFLEAKKTAEQESAALLERVPTIAIVIEGAASVEASVTLDGRPVAPDALSLSTPQQVDPGVHKIVAKKGARTETAEAKVVEGERARVVLRLTGDALAEQKDPSVKPGARDADLNAGRRAGGYIAIGVGAGALVTGAILTGLTASTKGALDDAGCEKNRCPKGTESDVALYNGLRVGSTVAYVAGVAVMGAGVVVLVTAPRASGASGSKSAAGSRARAAVELSIGWASVSLRGAF